jgi:UPF0042 nucleotide-binding protein
MQFIVITGLSGAGKSIATNALEDLGVYCVDNLPPKLLHQLMEICSKDTSKDDERIAVVADIRSFSWFSENSQDMLKDLSGGDVRMIFLDASDEEIINRYKMTRRRHPLLGEECSSLAEAIQKERELLAPLKAQADFVVDTSLLSTAQLRSRVQELFMQSSGEKLVVNVTSFGFKYGMPTDADLVFDVRCLQNPFYIPELKELTGLDAPVRDFVMDSPMTEGFLKRVFDFLDYMLPLYCDQEHKSQLGIAIGCTGGKHRSVAMTQAIYEHISQAGYLAVVNHRDIQRKKFNH